MTMADRQEAYRDALEMERRSVLKDDDEIDDPTPWRSGCGTASP